MQFRTKPRRKVLINITSLIDVMFLLLIFIMVTSTFMEQPGINLELPQAQSSVVMEQKEYALFINKEGKVYLNERQISENQLEAALKEQLPQMKDGALILKADRDVSHGTVVKVMDAVKKSGVKKLIIGTKLN